MIKKLIFGMAVFSGIIGLMYEDANAMKKSSSVPELSTTSETTIRPRSNSLPAGTMLLPYMEDNGLCFEAVTTPAVFDKYQGMRPVEIVKHRLLEIAKLGMKNPERLFSLTRELIKNYSEREDLIDIMGDDVDYIDAIADCIYERLLEKGIWGAHFVISRFYSPSSQNSVGSLVYNGKVLSREELISVGRYIEAVNWIKNDFETKRPCSPSFKSVIETVKHTSLPTTHYISWAIAKVLQ